MKPSRIHVEYKLRRQGCTLHCKPRMRSLFHTDPPTLLPILVPILVPIRSLPPRSSHKLPLLNLCVLLLPTIYATPGSNPTHWLHPYRLILLEWHTQCSLQGLYKARPCPDVLCRGLDWAERPTGPGLTGKDSPPGLRDRPLLTRWGRAKEQGTARNSWDGPGNGEIYNNRKSEGRPTLPLLLDLLCL